MLEGRVGAGIENPVLVSIDVIELAVFIEVGKDENATEAVFSFIADAITICVLEFCALDYRGVLKVPFLETALDTPVFPGSTHLHIQIDICSSRVGIAEFLDWNQD